MNDSKQIKRTHATTVFDVASEGHVFFTAEADDAQHACDLYAQHEGFPSEAAMRAQHQFPPLVAQPTEEKFYDAELIEVNTEAKRTRVQTIDGQVRDFAAANNWHNVGSFGVLIVKTDGSFRFHAYIEQRLRRVPERDQPRAEVDGAAFGGHWAWRIDGTEPDQLRSLERPVLTKPFFVPGTNADFIEDFTDEIKLRVPSDFTDLCEARGLTAEAVLRGFIADLCGLQNFTACPREDGYGSNGSDERMMADEYFERAYPNFEQR